MIDKTKLLILGLVAVALISVGAFFAWYITSNSYEKDLANQTTEYNKQLKAISDKATSDMALEIERHNKTQKELDDLKCTYIRNDIWWCRYCKRMENSNQTYRWNHYCRF